MKTIEIITNKIEELNRLLSQGSGKEKLQSKFDILEECEKALLNEEEILNFDFTKIIEILKDLDLNIEDLEKIIKEIKQVIEVKKAINLPELNFSKIQTSVLSQLNENLIKAKEIIEQNLEQTNEEPENTEEIQTTIEILEELKAILLKEVKEEYTDEMINIFFGIVNWKSLSKEDFDAIISEFYTTPNLEKKSKIHESVEFDKVVNLYNEFIADYNDNFKKNFNNLLKKYREEVCEFIDLENTRNILQFFKDNNVIANYPKWLLVISLYSDLKLVAEVYNQVETEYPSEWEQYLNHIPVWVNSEENRRKININTFRKTSRRDETQSDKTKTLYSATQGPSNAQYRKNKENLKRILKGDYVEGAYSNILMSKKCAYNFKLLKMFKIIEDNDFDQENTKNHISILKKCCEEKIHFAIELGLLHPPMDDTFREYDFTIPLNDKFQDKNREANIFNQSIRNYFYRNSSSVVTFSMEAFLHLFYTLHKLGNSKFYENFFSEEYIGTKSRKVPGGNYDPDATQKCIKENLQGRTVEEFFEQEFANNHYNEYITKYDEYSNAISDYDFLMFDDEYYDFSILEDDLIRELENNHAVYDILQHGENATMELQNEFVYIFGDKIISRYKVLRNASILKKKYGVLDKDMLLTSIVRNSYLSYDLFELIKNDIMESRLSL